MKRSRVFLSFLFVLVFVFQLGAMAFAAPENGIEFNDGATLEYRLTAELAKVDEKGEASAKETELVLIGEENKAAIGEGFSLKVGGDEFKDALNLKDALAKDISLAVPSGYYVSALALRDKADEETAPVDLLYRAEADASSANITFKAGALTLTDDVGQVYLDSSAVTGKAEADAFVLDIVLSKLDAEAGIDVTVGSEKLEADGSDTPDSPTVFTAPDAPEFNAELQSFSGWRLVYNNKSSVLVKAGDKFSPYASCSLEAVFANVVHTVNVTVYADKAEYTVGDTPVLSYTIDDGYTANVEYTVLNDETKAEAELSALTAGSYNVIATVSDVSTAPAGTPLSDENLRLIVNNVVFTVKEPVTEPIPSEEPTTPPETTAPPTTDDPKTSDPPSSDNTVIGGGDDTTAENPIEITITVKEPIYNAQTDSYEPADSVGYAITAGSLAPGHEIRHVTFTADRDKSIYTISDFRIVDSEGNEVSFALVRGGERAAVYGSDAPKYNVTVNGAAIAPHVSTNITVDVGAIYTEYSGKEQVPTEYTVDSLDSSMKLMPVFTGETDVCSVKSVELSSWEIVKAATSEPVASSDNPNGYTVAVNGSITIGTRAATVGIKDDITFKTNGKTAFKLGAGDVYTDGLLSGHIFNLISYHFEQNGKKVESPTASGVYDIIIDEYKIYDNPTIQNGKIVSGTGTDVTGNYDLTVKNGKVTVTVNEKAIALTITAKSGSFVYDGSAHTVEGWESAEGLKDGDKLVSVKYKSSATQTIPGENSAEIESYVIQTSDGKTVSPDKYIVNLVPGKITVTKPKLTLTAVSDEKVYDGKALNNNNVKASQDLSKTNFKLSVGLSVTDKAGNSVRNGPVNVGVYTKKISSVKITLNSVDVTEYFDVTCIDGTLTIKSGANSGSTAGVKTGDDAKLGLWIGILAASAVVIIVIVVILLKKRKNSDEPDPADVPAEPVDESTDNGFEIDTSVFDEKDDSDK